MSLLHYKLGPFQGVTQFPWVSPVYIGDIHVIKHVCFSPVNLPLWDIGRVSAKNQER